MAQSQKEIKNPYKILGVSKYSDEKTITEKYRNLIKKHHPDKDGNQEKFMQVIQAYEMIINRITYRSIAMERKEAVKIATKYHLAFIAITMFTLIITALAVVEILTYDNHSTLYALPILISLAALMRYMVKRTLNKVNMTYSDFDVSRDHLRVKEK